MADAYPRFIVATPGNTIERNEYPIFIPVGANGDPLPIYYPADGDAPTGANDGDRWIKDGIEYSWDSSIGASGAWVETQNHLFSSDGLSISAPANALFKGTPAYWGSNIVLCNLSLSGQGGSTHNATNNFAIAAQYWEVASSSPTTTALTVTSESFGVLPSRYEAINNTQLLVQGNDRISSVLIRVTTKTGTPPNIGNATISVVCKNAIIPS